MANNKNTKVPNVPNLRFTEFTKEWEAKTIDEIFELRNGYTPSKANQSFWNNGTIPWFRMEDIRLNGGVLYDAIQHITPEAVKGSGLFEPYSIILATTATIGEHAMIIADSLANQRFTNLKVRKSLSHRYDPYYLYYYFFRIDEWCLKNTNAGGLLSVDIPRLKRKAIYAPLLDEQTKIVKLLRLIDERIATQNKIIEKLQSLIKGLVDSLLENPSWEKVYLCSFMQFYSTNSLSWEQLSYSNGNVRNLHYGLIHGFQTSLIDSTLLPRILPNYLPKQYTVCQDGDVVFADASEDTNEIGKAIEFSNTINVKTVCGLHTIHGRDIKQKTILGFKGFAFNSRYFHDQVRRLAQGTKVYSITAKNLSSCYVYIPDIIKQENIVKLLNAYEENLSLNRTLLNKYEIQKQYLLQQMLI